MATFGNPRDRKMQESAKDRKIREFFAGYFPQYEFSQDIITSSNIDSLFDVYALLIVTTFSLPENFFSTEDKPRSLCITYLVRLIQNALSDISLSEETFFFEPSDLIVPKPARTRFFLHQLVSLCEFIFSKHEQAEVVFDGIDSKLEDLREKQEAVNELKDDMLRIRGELEATTQARNEIASQVAALQEECSRRTMAKSEIKKSAEEVDARVQQAVARFERDQAQLAELENEECRLKADIVDDPDLLYREIHAKEADVDATKSDVQKLRDLIRHHNLVAERAVEFQEQLGPKLASDAGRIQTTLDNMNRAVRRRTEARNAVEVLQSRLRKLNEELAANEGLMQRKVATAKATANKLAQEIAEAKQRMEASEREYNELRSEGQRFLAAKKQIDLRSKENELRLRRAEKDRDICEREAAFERAKAVHTDFVNHASENTAGLADIENLDTQLNDVVDLAAQFHSMQHALNDLVRKYNEQFL